MWTHKSVLQLIQESGNTDPVEEIKSRARKLVLDAFDLGWQGPPYNPIELAKLFHIDIIPNDSVVDASTLAIGRNKLQIQYNPFQKQSRINFSISHELGHILFSDCAEELRNREQEPIANRQLEKLCNMAAAEIQLPYAVFSNDVNSCSLTLEGLLELAKKYEASLESTLIRFTEVVNKPCAFLIGILNDENQLVLDYWKRSNSFEYSFPDDFIVPKESKSLECVAPGWTSRDLINWDNFKKNPHIAYSIGLSSYKRDNKKRIGIFLVPCSLEEDNIEDHKIFLEYGDATKPRGNDVKIIAQVVNTSAGLGLGFGKSLAKNYPIIKSELANWAQNKSKFKLGETNLIKVSEKLYVFQMLAQKGLYSKEGEIPLKYNDLRKCLKELSYVAKELNASVHMPQIGAGQAKGDWNIILGMLHDELISENIKVNIYILPGKAYNPKNRSNLTLFKENSTWQTEKLF